MTDYFEDEDKEGSGGKSGEIRFRFRDAASLEPRDDMLPPLEIQRLLNLHSNINEGLIKKQKEKRADIKAAKDKKHVVTQGMQKGVGGNVSAFKTHPLAQTAQFSGQEQKVFPTEIDPDLNQEQQKELENRLENRLENNLENQYRNVPKFNPTPRPRGA